MEHNAFLLDMLVLIGLAVVAATLVTRLKLPAVTGLLLAGVLAGPHGFSLVNEAEQIEQIAEIGVMLLLFTIGLEFSGPRLKELSRIASTGGLLQVAATAAITVGVALALGYEFNVALFFSFIVALSSTAVVLRIYSERNELDSPHGRFVVGTLIFQDVAVVLFVLLVPLLAGDVIGNVWSELGGIALRAALLIGGVLLLSRLLMGHIFRLVDATRSRELFLLTVLTMAVGTAWLSALAGLSLALGAFLAGVVIASSDFAHRAMGEILPLRDVLTSLFFISLGMLFDVRVLLSDAGAVAMLFLAFVVGKGLIASLAAMVSGFTSRVGWLAGVGLAQFGEFGFVLAKAGQEAGLVDSEMLAPLLAAGILSMLTTPLLMYIAPRVTGPEKVLRPLERYLRAHGFKDPPSEADCADHIVIAGYGPAGQLLAQVLKANMIPYLIFDLNAESVRQARLKGEPIHYGDILREEALKEARLDKARAVVVMFNDPGSLPRALDTLQRHAPHVPVLVRCRYLSQAQPLINMGADLVVVEEVETGLTMLRRVLTHLDIPEPQIRDQLRLTREDMSLNTERQLGGKHAVRIRPLSGGTTIEG